MTFIHKITLLLLLALTTLTGTNVNAADWRETATETDKIAKLLSVMPGASVIMLQMGERYKNLYWAAKQGKWAFAEYQIEEMEDLIETLKITRPTRAKTASEFQQLVFPAVPDAIKKHGWKTFAPAFEQLRNQCMACHAKNDHAFITLPIPKSANSPVLNMP